MELSLIGIDHSADFKLEEFTLPCNSKGCVRAHHKGIKTEESNSKFIFSIIIAQ